MTDNSSNQHGSDYKSDNTAKPSFSESVKTLIYNNKLATLSTLSKKYPDCPFGSLMPYAIDDKGRPIFLISTMAMHTQNIDRDSRASLFISEINSVDDPLNATRATLMGNISKVRENEAGIAKNIYLLSHPNANYWVSFSDFSFYKMEIEDIYFVGGFGSMGWVTVDEYYKAEIDPLADIASEIISHMNEDHSDSLILLSKAYTKIAAEEASMLSVDRFGFNVRIRAGQQMYGRRIAFSKEVSNSNEVRKILIQMVKEVKDKR